MNKLSKRILIGALVGAINLSATGCSLNNVIDTVIEETIDDEKDDLVAGPTDAIEEQPNVVEQSSVSDNVVEEKKDNIDDIINKLNISTIDVVTTNSRTPVYSEQGGNLGYLSKDITMRSYGVQSNGRIKIQYYNQEGYVESTFVTQSTIMNIDSKFNKVLYSTSDVVMTIPDYLSSNRVEETVTIPYHEVFEVFDECDDFYVVRCNNLCGYIGKDNLEELTGTFVVVDISDQELKLYVDNEVILDTPVVTGKESTPTHEGLFKVYSISHNRYLTGPGYKSWVDYFFAFNDGEGLHDAEYHTCDAIGDHGWRNEREFGGETYIRSGSHGCVNMLHDAVEVVDQHVYMDMPVLVKK
ncbi:MAG: L,D-transpeptidase [Candidatus Coprovivens sp.]